MFILLPKMANVLNYLTETLFRHVTYEADNDFQMVTIHSPLTWGIYDEPPADVPECGFLGELCPPSVRGKPTVDC